MQVILRGRGKVDAELMRLIRRGVELKLQTDEFLASIDRKHAAERGQVKDV